MTSGHSTETSFAVARPPGYAEMPPKAPTTTPARRPRLWISTPMYGGLCTHTYAHGLAQLAAALPGAGIECDISLAGGEALITRGRNREVANFLASGCTHLLFIDADVGFRAADVAALLAAREDVVCGAYPLKRINWQLVARAAASGSSSEQLAREGSTYPINLFPEAIESGQVRGIRLAGRHYVEVQDAATGFLLISREIIIKILEAYGSSLEYTTDYEPLGETHWKLFHADLDPTSARELARSRLEQAAVAGDLEQLQAAAIAYAGAREQPAGRYLSEDYWFSRLVQMVGGRIWLCLDVELSHAGQYVFRGHLDRVFPFLGGSRDAAARAGKGAVWPEDALSTPEPTAAAAASAAAPAIEYDAEWYRSHYEHRLEYRAAAEAIWGGSGREILDVGCGVGLMIERWVELGNDAVGIDDQPNARHCAPASVQARIEIVDFAAWRGRERAMTICLEVAEHIPASRAEDLCEMLARATTRHGRLYFSAAPPGQGGRGHVNEQPREYWIGRLERAGFALEASPSAAETCARLRRAAPSMPWLGANLIVLRRR